MNFFDKTENLKKLAIELESWRGTPYKSKFAAKKIGVDCARFVHSVFLNIGAINNFEIKDYPTGHLLHSDSEIMLDDILSFLPESKKYDIYEPKKNGDIILCRFRHKCATHAGIYFKSHYWHCRENSGVIAEQIKNIRVFKPTYLVRLENNK